MLIGVIFDFTEQVDDFVQYNIPIRPIILDYYLNFVIHFGNRLSSLIIFITVVIATSRLATRTEIIAMLGSGMSFYRLLWPYFLAGTLLTGVSLFASHYLVPNASEEKLNFEMQYESSGDKLDAKHVHREIEPDKVIYLKGYSSDTVLQSLSIEKWGQGELLYKIRTDHGVWHPKDSTWQLKNMLFRDFREGRNKIRRVASLDTTFRFTPQDFDLDQDRAPTMTTMELTRFIEREKQKGAADIVHYEVELHKRTAYPIATYVLILIGVSLASRKTKGGIGAHMALGFFLVALYIFSMKVATVAAINTSMEPALVVWMPNILFLGIGLWLLYKAPK